jgi:tRNA pseudouridine32 synthase / 23S rRNA pseudouridine746 synthase
MDSMPAQTGDITFIHCDADLLVLDKPAGLPAVPGRAAGLQDCAATRAQAICPDALVVHRLDMATSGLLVMARGPAAQRALSHAFAQRQIEKRYAALVHGRLAWPDTVWRTIDLAIAADWPNRPRQRIDPAGKPAVTQFCARAFDAARKLTRIELMPVTGRTHQLRVHLQALGHPIEGDALYGPEPPAGGRLMLHACALAFAHPRSGAPMVFESAVPF